jgi:putative acetyltransferase
MTYLPTLYSPDQIRAWMRDKVFPSQRVIVAELEGDLVGYVSHTETSLSNLYVLPTHQRRGVGSALLKVALENMSDEAELWVFEANTEAIRFYERKGFRTVAHTDGENEEKLPDRLMKKTA